jgi:hypothetical protein
MIPAVLNSKAPSVSGLTPNSFHQQKPGSGKSAHERPAFARADMNLRCSGLNWELQRSIPPTFEFILNWLMTQLGHHCETLLANRESLAGFNFALDSLVNGQCGSRNTIDMATDPRASIAMVSSCFARASSIELPPR